jgi:magnesium transporter
MIDVFVNDKSLIKKTDLAEWKDRKQVLVDVYKPTEKELVALSKKANIPLDYLRDSLDEDERPRVTELDNYSHLVYRAPHIEDKITKVFSFSIFISSRVVIVLHKHNVGVVEKFEEFTDEHKINIIKKGTTYVTFWLLDHINSSFFSLLDELEDDIDKVEKVVFHNPTKAMVRKIFEVKKILIYLHKAFSANRDVITSIEKGYLKYLRREDLVWFREIYNDLVQMVDMESTLREVLSTNLEIYLSTVSNNMNEVMKKLTVYASFVLVPTLISGIYGMNFNHMPEFNWLLGYPFALFLMALSVFLLYRLFKKEGWIGKTPNSFK